MVDDRLSALLKEFKERMKAVRLLKGVTQLGPAPEAQTSAPNCLLQSLRVCAGFIMGKRDQQARVLRN